MQSAGWFLIALLVVTTGAGWVWRARNGAMRDVKTGSDDPRLTSSDLGADLGARATLVQFSSAFCAPCRAARVVLSDVARTVDGVTHIEIDAESHLDLVRRLDIMRTPTIFVLDARGRVVKRASGAPRKAEVLSALGAAIPAGSVGRDGVGA
ncbi:MAG TPA: thioredoxin family protein [Acidothermaceae bacterium]